jgi:hypothetical protein
MSTRCDAARAPSRDASRRDSTRPTSRVDAARARARERSTRVVDGDAGTRRRGFGTRRAEDGSKI